MILTIKRFKQIAINAKSADIKESMMILLRFAFIMSFLPSNSILFFSKLIVKVKIIIKPIVP